MTSRIRRLLALGQFLHGFELIRQLQSVPKVGVDADALVGDVQGPLLLVDPPPNGGRLAAGVVDRVVQHLLERVGHDATGRAADVQPEIIRRPTSCSARPRVRPDRAG